MRNLFGTMRALAVRWQKEAEHTQESAVRYTEPWIFGLPLNVTGGFLQREQDTSYVRRVVNLNLSTIVLGDLSLGGVLEQEQIIPSSGLALPVVSSSRTLTAGIDLHYDSRNDPVAPTGGDEFRTTYQIGTKKLDDPSQVPPGVSAQSTVQKILFDASVFGEPIRRQVIAIGLHGRQIAGDYIEQGDEYFFGGATTLRGYRENEFSGSRIAWTNTEYRFLMARRTYVFGFFDSGYYVTPADNVHGVPSDQHVKLGYGFGMRVETSLGNFGISFALGQGDSISQAKVHMNIVNDF